MSEMNVFNTPEAKQAAEDLLKVFAEDLERSHRILMQRMTNDFEGFFWDHKDAMIKMAARVWEALQNGELREGIVYVLPVNQRSTHYENIYGVYRNGFVYLGLTPTLALKLDIYRINNGQIEFCGVKDDV